MVHTSSLVVFTAVAFGAVSSVIAAPLGQGTQGTPANGAASGALQQVDATIQSQDNIITQAKDKDALADQSKAKALEAQAKALEGQAVAFDPALAPKKEKSRKRLGESGTGKPRYGTASAAKKSNPGPKRMDTANTQNLRREITPSAPGGGAQRPATPAPAAAPAPVGNDASKRLNNSPTGAVGAPGSASKPPQVKQVAQATPGQELFQQNKDLTAMKNKFALADEQRAKALEAEAAAFMKQADTLDPALAKPAAKANLRTSPLATKPTPPNPAAPRVYRRGPGQPGQPGSDASGTIASQDKTLTALKDTDARKDASEAAKLEAEAQQLTNQADQLDPALKKLNGGRKKADQRKKDRTSRPMNDNKVGGQGRGQGRGTQGMRTPAAAPQAAVVQSPSQVARYYYDDYYFGRDFDDDELFGRELFDGEELYGREWYDLEELD